MMTRREMLKASAAFGAFNIIPARTIFGATAPSNQLTRALIGFGIIAHSENHLGFKGSRLVGLCDPDELHVQEGLSEAEKAGWGKIKAYKKEIDGLIFVKGREIPIKTDKPITIMQRPLRAQTAQGERVALASSERIEAGATVTFTIMTLRDDLMPVVKEWLEYGALRGIGQWRNSGAGRFSWEVA